MTDYIRLPRSALSDDLWRNGNLARLYLYLLSAIDNNGVAEVSLRRIVKDTRLSLREVRTCLDKLLATQKTTQTATQKTTQITLCDTDCCNKRATQKTTQIKPLRITPAEVCLDSFVDPAFLDAWHDWIEYRKRHNRPYKNEKEARKGYARLLRLSHNDPSQAVDIVDQTIANGWQGLFPDKSNGTKPIATTDNATARAQSRDRLRTVAAGVLSQSTDKLLSLYARGGENPDTCRNQEESITQ